MSYDSASTSELVRRLADTEETLAALRSAFTREQERYDGAEPGSDEHRRADSNLWQLQDDIERFKTRREWCLAALRHRPDTRETSPEVSP